MSTLFLGGMFAGKSKTLNIASYVKLHFNGNNLTITSTDAKNAIKINMALEYEVEDKTYLVDFKDFSRYCGLIGDEMFKISFNEEKGKAKVVHSKGKAEFPFLMGDEFPKIKLGEVQKEVEFDKNWLLYVLSKHIAFIKEDSIRPMMSVAHLYCEKGREGVCMTDTRVLYNNEHESKNDLSYEINLQMATIKPLLKLLSCSQCEKVKSRIYQNMTVFVIDNASIVCSCINGKYPNFKAIIPNLGEYDCVSVNKGDIMSSIARVDCDSTMVVFSAKDNVLTIESENLDFNKSSMEYLNVNQKGNMEIGFNIQQFQAVLTEVDSDDVRIYTKGGNRACVVKEKGDSDNLYIVMPMIIPNKG